MVYATTPSCETMRGAEDVAVLSMAGTNVGLAFVSIAGAVLVSSGVGTMFVSVFGTALAGCAVTMGCGSATLLVVIGVSVSSEGATFVGIVPDASCFKYIAATKA